MTASLLAFTAVAAIITVTPGLDTALTIRMTLRGGRSDGIAAAAGICSGLLVWGLATALGITLLLRASQTAYDALRIAGAAWLVVLGLRTLLAARRHAGDGDAPPDTAVPGVPAGTEAGWRRHLPAYRSGMLSNLLNPKVGVFYLTLLPQFVPAGAAVLPTTMLLALIHAVEGIAWLAAVAWLVARARDLMGRGAVRRAMERTTGLVLLGLGLRLAVERR